MNKEITNQESEFEDEEIYDSGKAYKLFKKRKYTHRQLSIMKQQNIQESLEENIKLEFIKDTIDKICGYCFKYQIVTPTGDGACSKCPLYRKHKKKCYKHTEFHTMDTTYNKKTFKQAHQKWCKKLGLLK